MNLTTVEPDLLGMLQSLIRQETRNIRTTELGVVTGQYAHESGSDKHNVECDVRLRDSGLELKRVPVATQRVGFSAIPNVDDLVLIQFIGGSLHGAVITGRLYNDADRPPEAKPYEMVYVSPDSAESDIRRAYMEFPNGNTLLVDDDKVVVNSGGTSIEIENGGNITITGKKDIVIKSDGNLDLQSSGDINMEAQGKLTLKAGMDLKAEGLSVSAKAQTSIALEGTAAAKLKGGTTTIAGMTSFSPS